MGIHPRVQAFAYSIYIWAVISLVTMPYYQQGYTPLLYIVVVWLILDFHNLMFMPPSILLLFYS